MGQMRFNWVLAVKWRLGFSSELRRKWRVSAGNPPHSHVSLVIVAYLLDPDVILGVNERLCCGVGLGEGYHASNVLEVVVVFHFDLILEQGREGKKETYTYTHWESQGSKASKPIKMFPFQLQAWVPHLRRVLSPASLPRLRSYTYCKRPNGPSRWPTLGLLKRPVWVTLMVSEEPNYGRINQ